MGNTAEKSSSGYACDTLAKEITFMRYRSGSDQTGSSSSSGEEETHPNSSSSSYNNNREKPRRPLTHQSSIRRRKELRASCRKSRNGEKTAQQFKLSDMEIESVDGKVCR